MSRAFSALLLLALSACSSMPARQVNASPCAISEASYECQVERYQNVSVD